MNRLYKSRKNSVIDGVCGGIGEYFDVDPVIIRIVAVGSCFITFLTPIIAYIVCMIIIPKAPIEAGEANGSIETDADAINASPKRSGGDIGKAGGLIFGLILIGFGMHFLLQNIPFFHPFYLQFWHVGWHYFWPAILILIGLLVIFKGSRK